MMTRFSTHSSPLPRRLRATMEALSGISMAQVKVFHNSPQPGLVGAQAFAQGDEIHLAPGEIGCLPHEAWHLVQQAQGRVRPTRVGPDGSDVNDDIALEIEADIMGTLANALARLCAEQQISFPPHVLPHVGSSAVRQLMAGTKERQFSEGRAKVVKVTSARERFVYRHRQLLGLSDVLPTCIVLNDSYAIGKYPDVIIPPNNLRLPLEQRLNIKVDGSLVIVMDNISLNSRQNFEEKLAYAVDGKIGKRTKSDKQYSYEGNSGIFSGLKIFEHFFKDSRKTSRRLGWEVEDVGDFVSFITSSHKKAPEATYDAVSKLLIDLNAIKTAFEKAEWLALVGSSVLMVVDVRTPDNTIAKLIDPDHPIIDDDILADRTIARLRAGALIPELQLDGAFLGAIGTRTPTDLKAQVGWRTAMNAALDAKILVKSQVTVGTNMLMTPGRWEDWFKTWRSEYIGGIASLAAAINFQRLYLNPND